MRIIAEDDTLTCLG